MRSFFHITLSLVGICGAVRAASEPGILPEPGQVIQRDFAALSVPRTVRGDTVGRVAFCVRYARYVSNKMAVSVVHETVAVDSEPPFGAVWNCADAPDQDNRNLLFYFGITDTRGRIIDDGQQDDVRKPWTFPRWCVLDRHPAAPGAAWRCPRAGVPPKVDGVLDDWSGGDTVAFANNDNRITARACWSRDTLYFGIRVRDRQVVRQLPGDPRFTSYLKDGIELFLDPRYERDPYRDLDEVQQVVPVAGAPLFTRFPVGADEVQTYHRSDLSPVPAAVGAADGGYAVELAFPWLRLGVAPRRGMRLGVNLVNSDRDGTDGVIVTASWTGASDLENHNPRKWGTMTLVDRRRPWTYVIGTVVLVLLAAVYGALRVRARHTDAAGPAADDPARQRLMRDIREYLQTHAADEEVSPRTVASRFGCSAGYLHRLFRECGDGTFKEYLDGVRMERAVRLLGESDEPVTDIAFRAGFGSYRTFCRSFKRQYGCTPQKYRSKPHLNV